jgi:hypothetical protein
VPMRSDALRRADVAMQMSRGRVPRRHRQSPMHMCCALKQLYMVQRCSGDDVKCGLSTVGRAQLRGRVQPATCSSPGR